MTAIFVVQIFALAILGVILLVGLVLAAVDGPAARSTEKFLVGFAYGLTVITVAATLAVTFITN